MKLGVCCDPESSSLGRDAGFDCVEGPAAKVLDVWNEDWQRPEAPLPVETLNLFLQGIRIVGPDPTPAETVRHYISAATKRASVLGTSIVVFGSAGARQIQPGFSQRQAENQMDNFLHLCATEAEESGVVIAIEPLHRGESNFINLVSEGAEWVRRINRPGVGLLADTYHMEMEGEPLSVLEECSDLLVHVHTADTLRKAPGTGNYDHRLLIETLRSIDYRGRIAIECHWTDMVTELVQARSRLVSASAPGTAGMLAHS